MAWPNLEPDRLTPEPRASTDRRKFPIGDAIALQFGLNLDEVIKFADQFPELAAVVKAEVPTDALGKFDFSTTIDPFIFRSGVITVQPGQQDFFNSVITGLEHAF